MSLLKGARDLANRLHQVCTPLHIFQAALPQLSYLQASYPQDTSLDQVTRSIWENLVPLQTREDWAREVQQEIAKQPHIAQLGVESSEFTNIEREARDRARQLSRPEDAVALAIVIERETTVQTIIARSSFDPLTLAYQLDLPGGTPPGAGQPPAAQQPAPDPVAVEMARATKLLDDGFLVAVKPTTDERFKNFQSVDTNTFLTTLAESARNRATVVCVGQEGSLISLLESVVADRLAAKNSFSGLQSQLNDYTGDLYKMDADSLVSRGGRGGTPKPATILRAAKQKLATLQERPILLIDHLEAIHSQAAGQTQSQDIEDLCFEIGERGRVLVFGIYRAPDDRSDYTDEAHLGRNNIKVLPFRPYDANQTKNLINSFYKLYWADSNPNRNFKFSDDAFDMLIALEPGSWHDLKRKVLPGLVIDITQDALETAFRGDAALRDTVTGALLAFKELKQEELPRTKFRAKFEPILRRAEEDVKRLLPPKPQRRLFGLLPPAPPQQPDPNKPIEITSARIVAELICHNRSEFHYPDPEFRPSGA